MCCASRIPGWLVLRAFLGDPAALEKPDFLAARDIVAQHLDELSGHELAGLLKGYGHAFDEAQVVASAQRFLQAHPEDVSSLSLLVQKLPSAAEPYVVSEACKEHPMYFDEVRNLPVATLPAVDECLRRKLIDGAKDTDTPSGQIGLGATLAFVARFATTSLMPDVARLLPRLQGDYLPNARAAALVYLMRWDPQTYSPQFEAAVAAPSIGDTIGFTTQKTAYAPAEGVRAVYRRHLENGEALDVARAASVLSGIGVPEDQALIAEHLQRLRETLRTNASTSTVDGRLESDLTFALLDERNSSPEQRLKVIAGCVSPDCKKFFHVQ